MDWFLYYRDLCNEQLKAESKHQSKIWWDHWNMKTKIYYISFTFVIFLRNWSNKSNLSKLYLQMCFFHFLFLPFYLACRPRGTCCHLVNGTSFDVYISPNFMFLWLFMIKLSVFPNYLYRTKFFRLVQKLDLGQTSVLQKLKL